NGASPHIHEKKHTPHRNQLLKGQKLVEFRGLVGGRDETASHFILPS
ncbi:Uncharacterized protein BM_BM13297, partial [Brugia malayi]